MHIAFAWTISDSRATQENALYLGMYPETLGY